jgi:RNA-dependent RNA polymerase
LLLLHPNCEWNEKEDPMVWIRDSQAKIKYFVEPNDDPAMLTIDVLRASQLNSPARLSPETIINLYENGVPWAAFHELVIKSLNEILDGFLTWSIPENTDETGSGSSIGSRRVLWTTADRAGAVVSARIARVNSSSARARGLIYDAYAEEEEGEEQLIDDDSKPSMAWWPDPVSGQPSCLEETLMSLLDSGFDPRRHWIVRAKLKAVIHRVADSFRKRCKIPVAESCSAFIVPGNRSTINSLLD